MNRNKKRYLMSGVAAVAVASFAVGGYAWYKQPEKTRWPHRRDPPRELTGRPPPVGKIEPDVQGRGEVARPGPGHRGARARKAILVEAGQLLVRLDPTDARPRPRRGARGARPREGRPRRGERVGRGRQSSSARTARRARVARGRRKRWASGRPSTLPARRRTRPKDRGREHHARRAQLSSTQAQLKAAELAVQDVRDAPEGDPADLRADRRDGARRGRGEGDARLVGATNVSGGSARDDARRSVEPAHRRRDRRGADRARRAGPAGRHPRRRLRGPGVPGRGRPP